MRVQLRPTLPWVDPSCGTRAGATTQETGAIAIIVALSSMLILVLAAFAVDIGNSYAQGRQLSVSADAGALAAARAVGQAYGSPTCTTDALSAMGADTIATQVATQVNAQNNKSGRATTTDTVTAHAYCSHDATAILVDVTTARDVPTGLAAIIGVTNTHPHAAATGQWLRTLIGTIRPWAACQTTVTQAQAAPGTTFAAPMDNLWGVCGTSSSGNWGAVDFNGGSNPATDLTNWTRFGYNVMPTIPGNLPADPGVSKSGLGGAFTAIVNTPILLPVAANYVPNASGNNGSFNTTELALVTFCGAYYQNKVYATDSTGTASTCWLNPYPVTTTTTSTATFTATGGAMALHATTLTVTGPVPFFDSSWVTNPNVKVTVAGAGPGGQDLTGAGIIAKASGQSVTLDATAKKAVTNATVTVTVTTTTTTTSTPPAPLQSNGTPYNQIQFRFLRLYANSVDASVPCSLNDTLCRGATTLFK